jgi:hypothetical protein
LELDSAVERERKRERKREREKEEEQEEQLSWALEDFKEWEALAGGGGDPF